MVTSSPYFLPLTFPIFALTCTVSYHMSIVMAHSLYVPIHLSWRNLPVVTPSKENNHPYRVWAGLPLHQSCISNQGYCQFITKTAVPRLDYSISQDAVPPSSSYILTSFSSVLLNIHDSGNNIDTCLGLSNPTSWASLHWLPAIQGKRCFANQGCEDKRKHLESILIFQ